jgi:rubrerythrin
MAALFNADEIFEIAVDIERNGEAFYSASADVAEDDDVKKLFEYLVTQEQMHRMIFENMRKEMPAKFSLPETYDPAGEGALYLKALADSHIFNKPEEKKKIATGLADVDEALDFALAFEKDSVLFYSQMTDITYSDAGREHVNKIIKEEKKHIIQLLDLKRKLAEGGLE